jgi:dTDP-L-rhamnose 4-epimerase
MNNGNVLITGGAGFIGSNLSNALIKKGYAVTVLDNLSKQIHGEIPEQSELYKSIKGKVRFIQGSVTEKEDWAIALEHQDIVIHLAAETGTGQSMYEIERYTNVNILGTSIFWDILVNQKHCIKKVIVASSRAIYGEGAYRCANHGTVYPLARLDSEMADGDFNVKCPECHQNVEIVMTSEDSKKHPTSVYGFTKQAQEEMSLVVGRSIGIPVVAFRYQNVYGPGQSLNNPYTGILSIFSKRIKSGSDIQIFEDGAESRDFVFISDVVDATILGLEKPKADFEVFNVGSGVSTDVLKVANTLKNFFKSNVEIKVTGQYRLGDIRHNYADLKKIKALLGFNPRVNFGQGISEFVNWVNTQKISADQYAEAMKEMKDRGLFK